MARPPKRVKARMTIMLGATLAAFIREHEYCGELDSGLDDDRVWMTCTCGASSVVPSGQRPRHHDHVDVAADEIRKV